MRVSVVICTLNRAAALGATLSSLRLQHHPEFEVIVVNGPSTDDTLEVLKPWRPYIRYYDNPERNLSVSRNIGIRHSTGDLLAFIDDDALPEPEWLTQAIPAFDDPEVASAGGIVFDHTGMSLQYRYAATDRLLRTVLSEHDSSLQCFPGTFQFPYLQGTNQIHRREPLLAAGGFDERIFFYGDDCDISGRLIDAGWVVRQLPNSPVHHKFLPSGIRDHQRITTDWFPVVHDHTYFSIRHATAYLPEDEILHHVHEFMLSRVQDTRMHEEAGRLPPGASIHAEATCLRAFAEGLRVGRERVGKLLPPLDMQDVEFLPFPTIGNERRRKIVMICDSYTGNITGGIGRLLSDLAPAVAARGHDVRVVTQAAESPAVDLEDDVWVHRIEVPPVPQGEGVAPDVLPPLDAFATAALGEVQRVRTWTEPDLVFAPMWDVPALGVLRATDLPVAVHISTPLAVIGPMAGYLRDDDADPPELRGLLAAESEVLKTADVFQANTEAVQETIRTRYGDPCLPDRWAVLNIGVKERAGVAEGPGSPGMRSVYFAGRFEARKGIDTLLAAMERILPDYEDVELVLAGEDRPLLPGEPPIGADWVARHCWTPWIDRVRMLGVVDDVTLHRGYANADVVVLPSRYESFGLVMAEAMMHGRPLVTTNTSGVREFVRDGTDALLVEPGDVGALEGAIRRLLDDVEYAQTLGKAARERFEEHLSIDRVAERFEPFFEQIHTAASPRGEVLAEGERVTIELSGAAAATVVVRAIDPVELRLVDSVERAVEMRPGERRRVRLDVTAPQARVHSERGRALIERVIVIRPRVMRAS